MLPQHWCCDLLADPELKKCMDTFDHELLNTQKVGIFTQKVGIFTHGYIKTSMHFYLIKFLYRENTHNIQTVHCYRITMPEGYLNPLLNFSKKNFFLKQNQMKWLTRYFSLSTNCDLTNLFLFLDLRFPITKNQGALGQMCLRSLFGSLLCFHSSALGKAEDGVLYVARKSDFHLPLSHLCPEHLGSWLRTSKP